MRLAALRQQRDKVRPEFRAWLDGVIGTAQKGGPRALHRG